MCQGVVIRGSACNIDTPVISELNKLNYIFKYGYTYLILINKIWNYLIEK